MKRKIRVINGPNLNMLGQRNVEIYGGKTYKDLKKLIKIEAKKLNLKVSFFQSNCSGKIIDYIQKLSKCKESFVIINPGALTHYCYALRDAIEDSKHLFIEVHISNIKNRESFRSKSVISEVAIKTISGLGYMSYIEALKSIK